jgi:RNA polymerase sigma-70 factor (ECF subfamily)
MTQLEFNHKLLSINNQLKGFALSLTSNKHDAEDLMQDTYLRALRSSDKYEEYNNFKSWMFTIMKNTFINYYRKKKRQSNRLNELIDSGDTLFYYRQDTESIIANHEIDSMISKLDHKFRYPLLMFRDGYKYEEIADKMNLKIGTVKSRIFMARRKLKKFQYN